MRAIVAKKAALREPSVLRKPAAPLGLMLTSTLATVDVKGVSGLSIVQMIVGDPPLPPTPLSGETGAPLLITITLEEERTDCTGKVPLFPLLLQLESVRLIPGALLGTFVRLETVT